MADKEFLVTFRGVRGSIPSPMLPDEIESKVAEVLERATPEDLKDGSTRKAFMENLPAHLKGCFGGNSSCVQLKVGGKHLVFDAGTGLRVLGHEYMKQEFAKGEGEAHIFLSHTHWDHIMGIPFFVPFHVAGNRFTIYGAHEGLEDRLIRQQKYEFFPVAFESYASTVDVVDLSSRNEMMFDDIKVTWKEMDHPGRSFSFRVEYGGKSFVYSTDAEYKKLNEEHLRPTIEFFRDADYLVFDSQYTFIEGIEKEDWGHSSTFIGVDLAVEAGVRNIIFYHHEPTYTDQKLLSIFDQTKKYKKALTPGKSLSLMIAQEGLSIDLLKKD